MNMFTAAADAIAKVFNTVSDVAGTASESVGIVTTYVHNRAVSIEHTDTEEVAVATAEKMTTLQAKLDADDKLMEQYKSIRGLFDR